MTYTLYHNPKCSKSRACLEILENKNIDFKIRDYLKDPLDKNQLDIIIEKLGLNPEELIRKNEEEFKQENINQTLNNEAIISLIIKHPKLMQRPILESNDKAVIGRPPENILDLLK